ncbi:MAG: lipopolysaccharide biosynthesis protein [Anaerolineales bacterium]
MGREGLSLAKVVERVVHFLSQIVIARLLGAELFGLYAIGGNVVQMVGIVSTLGLQNGVTSMGARCWREDEEELGGNARRSLMFAILSGILLGGTILLATPRVAIDVLRKPATAPSSRGFALAVTIAFLLATSVRHQKQASTRQFPAWPCL